MRLLPFSLLAALAIVSSCHRGLQPRTLEYGGYGISRISPDSSMAGLLDPYARRVNEAMNDIVGELPQDLRKELPDGTLGNFLADSYLAMARRRFDTSVQMAFLNNGGIRVNSLQKGPLRRGGVYEAMPFDNVLVIVRLDGKSLQAYLDFIAGEGGGGIAGVRMTIRDGKATGVEVQGRPLDPAATYVMANSDYTVFSGGFQGLRRQEVRRTGYLLRDATIDYCLAFRAEGRAVPVFMEKRIHHAR